MKLRLFDEVDLVDLWLLLALGDDVEVVEGEEDMGNDILGGGGRKKVEVVDADRVEIAAALFALGGVNREEGGRVVGGVMVLTGDLDVLVALLKLLAVFVVTSSLLENDSLGNEFDLIGPEGGLE
jgi:hypothetical protein